MTCMHMRELSKGQSAVVLRPKARREMSNSISSNRCKGAFTRSDRIPRSKLKSCFTPHSAAVTVVALHCNKYKKLARRDNTRNRPCHLAFTCCSWNLCALGSMGVDLTWLRTGVYVKAEAMGKLPIKGQLSVDPVDSKLKIKLEPPAEASVYCFAHIINVSLCIALFLSKVNKMT